MHTSYSKLDDTSFVGPELGVRPTLHVCDVVSEFVDIGLNRYHTHKRDVEEVLVIERDAERTAAGHAGENRAVAVAAREDELVEAAEAAGGGPVTARVEVRVLEQHVELRLVLDRALDPAVLVLQVLGRLGNELLCDLGNDERARQYLMWLLG